MAVHATRKLDTSAIQQLQARSQKQASLERRLHLGRCPWPRFLRVQAHLEAREYARCLKSPFRPII